MREAEETKRLDQAKLIQEEEFFKKWLKQRENLGIKPPRDKKDKDKPTEEDAKEDGKEDAKEDGKEDDAAPLSSRRGTIGKNQTLKKKDMTANELADLKKELR